MKSARFDALDALRGIAIVWMTVFHFCFDLNHFAYWRQDFYTDGFWTWQRTAIVSLFLFCAGLGQAVAITQQQPSPRFWRRWGQIAGCALLVTAGSWFMFPRSFIYFGVLHGIAVMLLFMRPAARLGHWLWPLGGLAIASKFIAAYAHSTGVSIDFLNQKAWNWLGWIGQKPVTEDYVPVFPWLGMMLWGLACGLWLMRHPPVWMTRPARSAAVPLAFLGRWSLSWYMLHQPVLIAMLSLLALSQGRPLP
jgi:uncharacterized membrane protein